MVWQNVWIPDQNTPWGKNQGAWKHQKDRWQKKKKWQQPPHDKMKAKKSFKPRMKVAKKPQRSPNVDSQSTQEMEMD
eukprot:785677-Karenia_brevis.AAC.1